MDVKRAKDLIKDLTILVDQIDDDKISEFNKMSEKRELEIKTKIIAFLNELDIRRFELGEPEVWHSY